MSELARAAEAAKTPARTQTALIDLIERQRPAVERQLAGAIDSNAFIRTVLSEVKRQPQLLDADPATVLGAVMLAAQLKLEVGPAMGEFHLTPRRNKGRMECLPIIGYGGYIKLALQSELVTSVQAFIVREGDHLDFGVDSDRGAFVEWKPLDFEETRPKKGALAVANMRHGAPTYVYLPESVILSLRPSYWASTPWKTHEDAMWKKSAIRALQKLLPKSTSLGMALHADEAVVKQIAGEDTLHVTHDEEPVVFTVQEDQQ